MHKLLETWIKLNSDINPNFKVLISVSTRDAYYTESLLRRTGGNLLHERRDAEATRIETLRKQDGPEKLTQLVYVVEWAVSGKEPVHVLCDTILQIEDLLLLHIEADLMARSALHLVRGQHITQIKTMLGEARRERQ